MTDITPQVTGKPLRWGIIGTGNIAAAFARALSVSKTGILQAVGSRAADTAAQFAHEHSALSFYGSYEALLADKMVDAVYISTPHPAHIEWAVKAAEAGKHILCEKPLALNYKEAATIIAAARRHNVFLMEAFMYRCHPQTIRLRELLQQKIIGEVRLIQATFGFRIPFNPEHRTLKHQLAGGGILDVGCYCTSLASLVAGAALGQSSVEPLEVQGLAHIGKESRVDEYAVALLSYPGDILAQLSTGVQLAQENSVRIYGTAGHILLTEPWNPQNDGKAKIIVHKETNQGPPEVQEIIVPATAGLYTLEADAVAEYITAKETPYMTWNDSLANMRTLDRWRQAIGLEYDMENGEKNEQTR